MSRRSGLCASALLACVSVLAGCPFGSEKGEGSGNMPMVLPPDGAMGQSATGGGAGDGAGSSGDSGSAGTAGVPGAGTGAIAGAGQAGTGDPPPPLEDGGTGPVVDVPLEELPDHFAAAVCAALLECVGPAKLRELTQREDCDTAVAAELRAKDFAHMDEAISAGHVLYNPSELDACLAGVEGLGCDVLTHSFPEPCVQVIAGNVPIGGECMVTAECEGTAFCTSSASCPSTCQALLAAGATCSEDGECGDELACIGGRCAALSVDGEPCAGDSGQVCALGLSCTGSTDVDPGSCSPNAEVQVGAVGDACEPGGALCEEGLSCVFDGGSAFHCEAAVASGGDCHLGLPGQCPVDEYCDSTDITVAGVCRALPGDGDACVLGDLCGAGTTCVMDGPSATCRAIGPNGADCSTHAECRSARCEAGRCEPPLVCG